MITPKQEAKRLAALRDYKILDTPSESWSDDIALIASKITGCSIALISFVDHERQWFKARIGLTSQETPREEAFCNHTISGTQTMVVEDALADERFMANPAVIGDPHIRFYAGSPLIDRAGNALGALCVIDRQPRQLAAGQAAALEALGRGVILHLEQRRLSSDLAAALSDLAAVRSLLPICAHCKCVRDDKGYWQRVEEYFGKHAQTDFSHGICPACVQKYFPTTIPKSPTLPP